MKPEDDFISKLMDETYNQVEHPSNELSNQNVASLFDYFKEREDSVEGHSQTAEVSINHYPSFIRIKVDGKTLDVPQDLNWISALEAGGKNKVYEIKDEAFHDIISELCGRPVKFFVIEKSSVVLCENLPTGLMNFPKAA